MTTFGDEVLKFEIAPLLLIIPGGFTITSAFSNIT